MNPPVQPPLIVAGMHRSGTSLTAGLLAAMGVDMGRALVPPDRDNRRGYFEDQAFVAFNRAVIATCVSRRAPGWPDWGWDATGRWREPVARQWAGRARKLLSGAGGHGGPWGWKDPRNTLLLDLWAEAAPGARFVLVYRPPWAVADSMQRLSHPIFRQHPEYALPIWSFYNRRLLAFHAQHRDRCVLVAANALVREPAALRRLLLARWPTLALEAADPAQVNAENFTSGAGSEPILTLLQHTDPEVTGLLAALEAAADLPAGLPAAPAPRFAGQSAPGPGCSIVVPCYNQGDYLLEAVASVEKHAPAAAELLIVDDASDDPRTMQVLATLEHTGYRILRQRRNGGLSAARNAAIATACSAFILPLDADNRLRPGFIEAALAILAASPRTGVVYPDRLIFGAENHIQRLKPLSAAELVLCPMIDACAVFRRAVWAAGGYDPGLDMWEDWEFWIRAAAAGWELQHWEGIGFDYRLREGSMSRRHQGKARMAARMATIHARNAAFIATALGPGWTPEHHRSYLASTMGAPGLLSLPTLRAIGRNMRWQGPRRLWQALRRLAAGDRPWHGGNTRRPPPP